MSLYVFRTAVVLTIIVYVAAVWNTYRKTHLMVLDAIIFCIQHLRIDAVYAMELQTSIDRAESLARGISASVPFHLTSDLGSYCKDPRNAPVGTPLAGLLLLHPLNVLLHSTSVPSDFRGYASQCLAWIGSHLKIGQASVLANVTFNLMQ